MTIAIHGWGSQKRTSQTSTGTRDTLRTFRVLDPLEKLQRILRSNRLSEVSKHLYNRPSLAHTAREPPAAIVNDINPKSPPLTAGGITLITVSPSLPAHSLLLLASSRSESTGRMPLSKLYEFNNIHSSIPDRQGSCITHGHLFQTCFVPTNTSHSALPEMFHHDRCDVLCYAERVLISAKLSVSNRTRATPSAL